MRSEITPGQTSDYLGFDLVMADNLPEPSVLLADRGYDSDNVRKTMEARDVVPVIPMRKTRKLRVKAIILEQDGGAGSMPDRQESGYGSQSKSLDKNMNFSGGNLHCRCSRSLGVACIGDNSRSSYSGD